MSGDIDAALEQVSKAVDLQLGTSNKAHVTSSYIPYERRAELYMLLLSTAKGQAKREAAQGEGFKGHTADPEEFARLAIKDLDCAIDLIKATLGSRRVKALPGSGGSEGRELRKADELTENLASLLTTRGFLHHQLGYQKISYKDFTASATIKETAQLWNLIGKCLKDFGETDDSIAAQKKALEMEPTLIDAEVDIVVALMEAARAEPALAAANAMVDKLLPKSGELRDEAGTVNTHLKLVIGYRGLLTQSMGMPEDALSDLFRSMRADPNDPQALYLIGVSHFRSLLVSSKHCFFSRYT